MAIGSLMGSAIVKQIGLRQSIFFGAMGHFVFIFATILPTWQFEFDSSGDKHRNDLVKFL